MLVDFANAHDWYVPLMVSLMMIGTVFTLAYATPMHTFWAFVLAVNPVSIMIFVLITLAPLVVAFVGGAMLLLFYIGYLGKKMKEKNQ